MRRKFKLRSKNNLHWPRCLSTISESVSIVAGIIRIVTTTTHWQWCLRARSTFASWIDHDHIIQLWRVLAGHVDYRIIMFASQRFLNLVGGACPRRPVESCGIRRREWRDGRWFRWVVWLKEEILPHPRIHYTSYACSVWGVIGGSSNTGSRDFKRLFKTVLPKPIPRG